MPGLQEAMLMQMENVAPSLAYCTRRVKNHADLLDNPCLRMQNLATLPAKWNLPR